MLPESSGGGRRLCSGAAGKRGTVPPGLAAGMWHATGPALLACLPLVALHLWQSLVSIVIARLPWVRCLFGVNVMVGIAWRPSGHVAAGLAGLAGGLARAAV